MRTYADGLQAAIDWHHDMARRFAEGSMGTVARWHTDCAEALTKLLAAQQPATASAASTS